MSIYSFVIAAAVNDEEILANTLLLSPDIASKQFEFIPLRNAPSASIAYNEVLESTTANIVIFIHQDVYLPAGWVECVRASVERLDVEDPSWAVLGVYGVAGDGRHIGRLWSGDQQIELVGDGGVSGRVVSLDEVCLVLRADAGLRFDRKLPHFHLYGTDIVQVAVTSGRTAHVIAAPLIHNTIPVASLKGGFVAGYKYLQRKWQARLPIVTSMTTITRHGLPLARARARHWYHARRAVRLNAGIVRMTDVVGLARKIGYEL